MKLKELRLSNHLTQAQLAEKIGYNQTAIGKYERGDLQPSNELLCKFADIFGCSVDYLLGREDDFGNVETNADLSEEEKDILATYRALPAQRRKTFMYFVQSCKEELNSDMYFKI